MDADDAPQPGLFDVDPSPPPAGGLGRVEAHLTAAIEAGTLDGTITAKHRGLVGSALAGARAMDWAERWPSMKSGYLLAQLLTPYRETCTALGLPVEVAPAEPAAPGDAALPESVPSWLSDQFGTPSD